jgi:hypothetical protein
MTNPAITQPLAPTRPIAPPTAPTMVVLPGDPAAATTARGFGAQSLGDLSPASTAKGLQPAPSYPPPTPATHQAAALPTYAPAAPTYAPAAPTHAPAAPTHAPAAPTHAPAAPTHAPAAPTYAPAAPAYAPAAPPYAPAAPPYAPAAPPYAPAAPAPARAPVLLEVTPRGLGIATVAGYCEELIRRNARVPTEVRKLFTTLRDQQEIVRIVVCQGESRRLDDNTVIGDLVLQNLPPRPRGETSIEVTFSLDPAGLLHVRARDAQTGVEQRATLDLVGDVAPENVAASRDRLQQLRR